VDVLEWARAWPEVVELACKNLKKRSFVPSVESASPSDMRYRQRWLLKSCCNGIETWEGWDKLAGSALRKRCSPEKPLGHHRYCPEGAVDCRT
jgi:hypothetical protein